MAIEMPKGPRRSLKCEARASDVMRQVANKTTVNGKFRKIKLNEEQSEPVREPKQMLQNKQWSGGIWALRNGDRRIFVLKND